MMERSGTVQKQAKPTNTVNTIIIPFCVVGFVSYLSIAVLVWVILSLHSDVFALKRNSQHCFALFVFLFTKLESLNLTSLGKHNMS